MTPAQLLHTLQLTDSFFPVGAFAYSDGLETAAVTGRVRDADSLGLWLDHFLKSVFVTCDGLALLKCMRAAETENWSVIRSIDQELTALKPAAATRASSRSIGRRLLATCGASGGGKVPAIAGTLPQCNAATAYALVFSHHGVDARDAILGYGYARLAGMISAALRLISLGQQQGQALLTKALADLPDAADEILRMEDEPLRSFSPLLDVQQMNHRYVYSRLFRS